MPPPARLTFSRVGCINVFSCCQTQSANCFMNYVSTQKVFTRTVLTLIPDRECQQPGLLHVTISAPRGPAHAHPCSSGPSLQLWLLGRVQWL